MLERRQQWRRQVCTVDGDRSAECGVDGGRRLDGDPGRGGGPEPVDLSAGNLAQPLRQPGDLFGGEPPEAGQVGPLVLVRLQGGQVQEHRGPAARGTALQRRGDQIAKPTDLQNVLGGEEPVVAGQVHSPLHGDRFAEQPTAHLPGGRRRNRCGEEQPHMRAQARAGHLQRGGCADGAGSL